MCQWSNKQIAKRSSDWQRTAQNEWKWNVNGSSKGKPGAVGIGGVLRNDCGEIMVEFASSIG
ncbi:hypothetical protein A2U01_0039151 [Trifolium medium]|uniref:Uncharacterized protein n=1 Tax=Trifolium medium TaxID=97028 RepID=A0A392Q2Q0_9FABA|nr:hypothetical protein [Trifolium medium]